MRQVICNLRTGETVLENIPAPVADYGHVLIATRRSLVSQGTEKMLVTFGKASLLQKARSQPEKVRQVLAKIRTDGLIPTVEAVFRRLDEPIPLGYCNSGRVVAIGEGVEGFKIGDRVASNGPHAEVVSVPANLCAKVPDEVSDDAAAFTVIGAIGLQGIRLIRPELGETVAVIGLGLIGQITAQLLRASGCRVVGFDFDHSKVEVAASCGITAYCSANEGDPVRTVLGITGGMGADGVIITASSSSNDVIAQSAKMSRKRGRIVLVGVVGLAINRSDFYEKELTFQVSCSYGPGRYEEAYEGKGLDYPPAFVRWTENRNFGAVLEALRTGGLRVTPLISRRVPLESCREIYDQMDGGGLASLFVYDDATRALEQSSPLVDGIVNESRPSVAVPSVGLISSSTLKLSGNAASARTGALAIIGAGNFTKMSAMPALVRAGAPIKTIVSASGVTGTGLARKYSIPFSSTDTASVLADPEIRGVVITTRHNLHASQVIAAIKAGKHVLVEKPLCIKLDELRLIEMTLAAARLPTSSGSLPVSVTVGFNRRFSPHAEKIKALLGVGSDPISVVATMNAGEIPPTHWVHDLDVGGGRLIGEACHFIDFAIFLTGSLVDAISAIGFGQTTDTASILLRHLNGSTSVVNYFANGHREVSKERVEIYSSGRTLLLDNFRELHGYGFKSFSLLKTKQDKGHNRQFQLFADRVRSDGPPLISWPEIENGMRATLAIPRAIAERRWINVAELD